MAELERSQQLSPFACEGLEVHFIYSFNLKEPDAYLVTPELIASLVEGVKLGAPKCRRGIAPHLKFKSDSGYIGPTYVPAKLQYKRAGNASKEGQEIDVLLGTLVRVFPTGAACCVSVHIPREAGLQIDTAIIRGVLSLVRQQERSNHLSTLSMGRRHSARTTVYSVFVNRVRSLCRARRFSWAEEKEYLNSPKEELQTPWVVTVTEVSGAVAAAFCATGSPGDDPAREKMLKIRKFEADVAEIVFRSVSEDFRLEPAYVTAPTVGGVRGLFSVNVDARLYVNVSRRSILCVCCEADKDPARYFIPGLLDICEMVRIRWHSLIMMNKALDETIRGMREKIRGEVKLNSEEQLSAMMKLRDWLATSLEDPAIYVIAGDALSKIYEDLRMTFRIPELREMAAEKIEALDRMYRDFLQREWVRLKPISYTETMPQRGRKLFRSARGGRSS